MVTKTYGFKWHALERGDEYILNESSYACLFTPEQQPRSLRPLDTWLDIGTHFGSFSLRASQWVKRVIAVEPAPANLAHLRENIATNGINNIIVIPAAVVGDDRSQVELGLGRTFHYTNRVGHIRGREHIMVMAVNINQVIRSMDVNKIKMDCEGSEVEILEALDSSMIDEIIMEWHFTLIPDPTWEKMRAALDKLKSEGFSVLRMPLGDPTKRWTAILWLKKGNYRAAIR